jgi:hypothetical protein
MKLPSMRPDRERLDPNSLLVYRPNTLLNEQHASPGPWNRRLPFLAGAVLENDLIDDLSAQHAPPPVKLLTGTIELFKDHCPTASMTLHGVLLCVGKYY